ncbi:ABC transporter permease subunit, partial [Hafnia alvei]
SATNVVSTVWLLLLMLAVTLEIPACTLVSVVLANPCAFVVAEVVFSWPGLGRWLINAIRQQDFAAISAGVMLVGTLVLVVNVLSDIVGALTNPLKHKEWYALR